MTTGALAFVVAATAMTLPELVAGRSLGQGDCQTTLFGGEPRGADSGAPTTTSETKPESEAETETTSTSATETTGGEAETTHEAGVAVSERAAAGGAAPAAERAGAKPDGTRLGPAAVTRMGRPPRSLPVLAWVVRGRGPPRSDPARPRRSGALANAAPETGAPATVLV